MDASDAHIAFASFQHAPFAYVLFHTTQGILKHNEVCPRGWVETLPWEEMGHILKATEQIRGWRTQLCHQRVHISAWKVALDVYIAQITEVPTTALEEPERLLDVILRTSVVAIVFMNRVGQIVFANHQAEHILGLETSDLLERSYNDPEWDITTLDGAPIREEDTLFRKISDTLKPSPGHIEVITWPSGERKIIEINGAPVLDEDGELSLVLFSLHDITSRMDATAKLERSEKRLKLATDAARIGVWAYDHDNRLATWSDRVFEFYGVTRDDVLDYDTFLQAQIEPEEWARISQQLEISIEHSTIIDLEFRHKHINGTQRYQRIVAQGQKNQDGVAAQIVGIAIDTTETRYLEEQLLHAQKMESVGLLAGGVAHDFNNLLTAILSYLDLIEWSVDDEETLEMVTSARMAADHGAALTQQLLTFARKSVVSTHIFDLRELLTSIKSLIARVLHENIVLTYDLCSEPCWIDANPGQMEQVILNLVSNARDAIPTQGSITITLKQQLLDAHTMLEPGPYIQLSVEDTGVGMSEDVRAHIFEPFFTTKVRGKGTGLGLSTCYGIVSRAAGALHVVSKLEQGSTFTCSLPARQAPDEPKVPTLEEWSADTHGHETIMLVEDNQLVRAAMSKALKKMGYRVLEAENGIEALSLSERVDGRIDCVVTDVMMPQMGGAELARGLEYRFPEVPILFASGYPAHELEEQGFQESEVHFLQKPFDPFQLARTLRNILDL